MKEEKVDRSENKNMDDHSLNSEENGSSEKENIDSEKENIGSEKDVLEEPTYEELIETRDGLQDRLMRSLADLENFRKRSERDRKDAELYGGTKLARDLLSVFDNLSRALENIDENLRKEASALVEGLELTQRELLSIFSKHKIEQVQPLKGDKFDPKFHQAMFEAPVPGSEKGTIIQVMTNGFKIGDRLLRPSQVGVSSNDNFSPEDMLADNVDAEVAETLDNKQKEQ